MPEFTLWSGSVPEPPPSPQELERGTLTLIGRIALMVSFAALGALLVIFAEPLWQGASGLLNADSQIWQAFKPSQQAVGPFRLLLRIFMIVVGVTWVSNTKKD
jgi:hypothetical protein